ncbi:MAG: TlpA family protein disulfide reductase [Bacteroidetes bacterium]|nr:TlpA family protein disulfide reductase [Bacteroidota bacterium]
MSKKLINLFLLIIAALAAIYFYNKYRVAPDLKLNELGLVDENGAVFDINTLKGKKVVISFYASWCGNCLEELEVINKIKEKELSDVEIVCITDESLEKLNNFKSNTGYPFKFLKLNKRFPDIGIHSIPVTYIVNTDLQIVKEQVGYLHWDDPSTLNHIKGLF